ncbi:MAG: hypothetical protein EOM87_00195 [Clostridia bacterium]|nr:hypothetical protein [Clostridia bacterium]
MEKLKAFYRKYQSKVTISMNKQPLIMTLLWLFLLNMVILIVAAIVAVIVAPEVYGNVIDAFASGSLKWMISPNSILDMEGNSKLLLLAGTVVVIEIVLFTGTILALTTNSLKDYFMKTGNAKGKLMLRDHMVILNWNSKVPEIIIDLMHKGESVTVLILSSKDRNFVKEQIKSNQMDIIKKHKVSLVVRQGDPFMRSELEDISIAEASSIMIMAEEKILSSTEEILSNDDLNAIKLLLLVGGFDLLKNCNIVVEVEEHNTVETLANLAETVKTLKGKTISSFSFNRKLGHILAQTVFQPRLAAVYMDLFSFKGEEFYPTANCEIEEYLANYTESVPIINMKNLFVLAESANKVKLKRKSPYYTDRRLKLNGTNKKEETTLLIVGENKKSKYMIENLSRKPESYFSMQKINKIDDISVIAELQEKSGKKIVMILSDDRVAAECYDKNVFCTLISLNKCQFSKEKVSLVTEILDPANLRSIQDFNVNNAVVSNQLISLIITQILCNVNSKEFHDALLLIDNDESEGLDIEINNIEEILDINQDLTFSSRAEFINSFFYSLEKKYMPIGYIKENKIEYLSKDLDKAEIFEFKEGDQLILIKY